MLNIIAVVIYLGVAFIMYRIVLKNKDNLSLSKKDFLSTLVSGALPCTICIIIFELLFDRFILKSSGSIGDEIITSFFRAALIEELFKYIFCRIIIKNKKPATKIEYMLLCGMIGAGYGLIEKLALGGGAILIVNAFLPLHIFFQFLMGALLYEADMAAAENNNSLKNKKYIFAYVLPFLVHGTWDCLLSVGGGLLEIDSTIAEIAGLVILAGSVIGGLIAEIKVVKKMIKMD